MTAFSGAYGGSSGFGASGTAPALGFGMPQLNGDSIATFLRQQLAERAKRMKLAPRSTSSPFMPVVPASMQLFGSPNGLNN
jgi:hypothetical protein